MHCLRTPKLRDFRLALDWNIETTHSGGPGYGLVVHFRRNRETGAGHMLELFMERNTSRFSFSLDGRDIAVSEGFRVDMEKVQSIVGSTLMRKTASRIRNSAG